MEITAEEFERQYAERSGITVEQLREMGRIVAPCHCGEDMCEGWQSTTQARLDEEREWRELSDDELVAKRTITRCIENPGGGWDVTFSCGHLAVYAIQPWSMEVQACAQCIEILVDRQNMRRERL